jgi:hypothetical protein
LAPEKNSSGSKGNSGTASAAAQTLVVSKGESIPCKADQMLPLSRSGVRSSPLRSARAAWLSAFWQKA